MTYLSRRRFFRGGLGLVGLSLLSGCGIVPLPGQPASSGRGVSRIGYLAGRATPPSELEAFREGLRELGYVEGRNVIIEVRLFESPGQGAIPAGELVALPVDVIVTSGAMGDTQVAMDATRTIPIVFSAAP